jgi:glutamate 5-kinase
MRRPVPAGRPVVVKVGSSSLSQGGRIDEQALVRVIDQVSSTWATGRPVILVTSGAVAAGLSALGRSVRPKDVVELQVAAAVGQSRLMERYNAEFTARGVVTGQVLLTKSVLSDREQYLYARGALERMLAERIVPIVNENDTVAVEELRLGDNDRLAALVSHLVSAGLLVLLTDTPGLLTSDPRMDVDAELLSAVRHTDDILDRLAEGAPGPLGSGGIASKVTAARMAAWSGIPTVIAPATEPDAVRAAVAGEAIGTWVDPRPAGLSARKLWIAFGQRSEGSISVDAGAVDALVHGGRSLLPVGVTDVVGAFPSGAAVEISGPDGAFIGKGVVRMSADTVGELRGRRSNGSGREVVHRDDLVIFAEH